MAAFQKFDAFVDQLAGKVHNLSADTLKIALTNTLPTAGNSVLSDITQITAGNGYSAGGFAVSGVAGSQTGGVYSLTGTDPVLTASGSVGPFRAAVLYNDTPTSPADPLIGWWDYGSSVTLASGETFTVDFGAAILTLT